MTAAVAFQTPLELFDFSAVYELVTPKLAKAGLPAVVQEIASLFDGCRSAEEVVGQAQISETKTRAVVRKLTQLGIIRARPTADRRSQREDFTPQEQAFFSAEIGPIDECDLPFESLSDKLKRAAGRVARNIVRR